MNSATRRRSERVEARVTSEQKALLERAAALEGRSMADFIITSAHQAAASTITRHELLQLSPRDQGAFVEALLNPPIANETLRAIGSLGRFR